jgi:hypothetical protein
MRTELWEMHHRKKDGNTCIPQLLRGFEEFQYFYCQTAIIVFEKCVNERIEVCNITWDRLIKMFFNFGNFDILV